MFKKHIGFLTALSIGISLVGCVEEFEPELQEFEDNLVVEGTITNELKHQTIYLNRTYTFEEEQPSAEVNATVTVEGGGNVYAFQESRPGTYTSINEFRAQQGTPYQLRISTHDGVKYHSSEMQLPNSTDIDELYVERFTTDLDEEGVGIFIDNENVLDGSKNYRYEFIETYKVIAPDWNNTALINVPDVVCDRTVKTTRERDEQVCYTTVASNAIILANTENLTGNNLRRFQVRFINRDNYIISHRYSVLVRQYVQSNEAYSFYETLRDFSGSESIFSETQPGFLEGNIEEDVNTGRKVLGFFDVATVSEKRLFFDYEDLFPGEELPPYADPCQRSAPKIAEGHGPEPRCILESLVNLDLIRFITDNEEWEGPQSDGGPFIVVPRVCGDCTVLGTTEVPEFWFE